MRLVAGITLVLDGVVWLREGPLSETLVLHLFNAGAGVLLLVGLWTPIAGVLTALIALWQACSHLGNLSNHIMLGTFGAALALLGPGAWSVDARLFGWKRIDIRDRKS
jgi:putative oxidoreductase